MELILCGATDRLDELVKYITLSTPGTSTIRVEEVVYSLGRSSISIARNRVLQSAEPGAAQAQLVLRVLYPPSRTHLGRALTRGCIRAEVLEEGDLTEILQEIGCKRVGRREYIRREYLYRGGKVVVVGKKEKEIVFVVVENTLGGEALMEEIKSKLSIWVDLVPPPQEVWDIIIGGV